ncbi:MAG: hypothetical protein IKZ13_06405 [Akkermansia sp.]|nr:hypothetical protein [Akkermansia sp.]
MNIRSVLHLLLPLALTLSAKADLAEAEQMLRDGKPAEALAMLQLEPHTPAVLYWKGRALTELNRYPQAVVFFSQVPAESVYYPYSAKALIYCAWQSQLLDFVEYVAPLTASSNEEIATLAQAALAEFQLRHTTHGDVSTLEPLRKMAARDENLKPMVQLLNIEEMRRSGQYAEAIEACREMESLPNLSIIMKQRVRLALAEIYYEKAEAAKTEEEAPIDEEEDDEGKGEETLLHFISANPESPLLEEAFRHLDRHNAFTESEYAQRKLNEWSEELNKPHRAALALAVRQRLQLSDPRLSEDDVTIANTAATALPNEPTTQLILGEQVRRLINSQQTEKANLYLDMLKPDMSDPRYLFYRGCCLPQAEKGTAENFYKSAELASADLQPAALSNAMYSAVLSGEQAIIDELLTKELPPRARRAILLMHAGLILHKNPAQARAEIESVQLLTPTEQEQTEILLLLAELDLQTAPANTLNSLQKCPPETRNSWQNEQELRYYSLQLQAADKLRAQGTPAPKAIDILTEALQVSTKEENRIILTFNLAEKLAAHERHDEAATLLVELAEKADTGELKAKALYLAARQAERLSSQEQLNKAVEYYAAAAELNSPYKYRAQILQARLLAWINRGEEAQIITNNLLRNNQLSATDRAMALSVQAHDLTLQGTDESVKQAIEANRKIFSIGGLPREWIVRARIQKASLHARSGDNRQALENYCKLIDDTPTDEAEIAEADWFILYFAGAGAIAQYIELKEPAAAAELAERIAAWPLPTTDNARVKGPGKRADQFLHWADNIRKHHFLPTNRGSR